MSELSSQPTPIQTIYNWYRSGILVVNRQYQRKLVWTRDEKQKLIDSILQAYPIPLVLLAAKADSQTFEILDGLQRLHTIVSFIENSFPTAENRYFDVEEFTRAKEERELGHFEQKQGIAKISRADVSKILDYVLPISIIRNATSSEITVVFGRINSYGHRLSEQERRQAGLVSRFAEFVRKTACDLRGDVSYYDILPLYKMPQISIDLPKGKDEYGIEAKDVFWVKQGILRSTDLRDSLDEQVIADLVACIVSGSPIERSKDALDAIYDSEAALSTEINARLQSYGTDNMLYEIKYCIELLEQIVRAGSEATSLRSLIFENRTTNPFPTVFASIFLALHEISFQDNLVLGNAVKCHEAIRNVQSSLRTGRDSIAPDKRRNNINMVKGLIRDCFVSGDVSKIAYGSRRELDIRNTILRSHTETPRFEFKQGLLALNTDRSLDRNVYDKVIQTACAISNIGKQSNGMIVVGIADKQADAERIARLDSVNPSCIGNRWVVGVDREASRMNITIERYYQHWREKIAKSKLSDPLKSDLLSNLDMCLYEGHHILILSIPSQSAVSFFDGRVYVREADETVEASPEKIVAISRRFE